MRTVGFPICPSQKLEVRLVSMDPPPASTLQPCLSQGAHWFPENLLSCSKGLEPETAAAVTAWEARRPGRSRWWLRKYLPGLRCLGWSRTGVEGRLRAETAWRATCLYLYQRGLGNPGATPLPFLSLSFHVVGSKDSSVATCVGGKKSAQYGEPSGCCSYGNSAVEGVPCSLRCASRSRKGPLKCAG